LIRIEKITFVPEYTIFLQHGWIVVGLMGVFMIVAAFRADRRIPILIYGVLEKAFFVYSVMASRSRSYVHGFSPDAGMDAAVVLYTVIYFGVYGVKNPCPRLNRVYMPSCFLQAFPMTAGPRSILSSHGIITIGQTHPLILVGYFGVPPKCRVTFRPTPKSILVQQTCFQRLTKIRGFFHVGPLLALSIH
jgi:hypothetical protein